MHHIEHYIAEYHEWFYLITVLWTFLEGETFVILAAAVAAQGMLDPVKLGICAGLGSFVGDQCWFFLGRHFGHVLVRRFPQWKAGIDMVHRWIERWEILFILSFRFLYGVRNFSSAAMGLSDLNAYHFLVLNFISAALWAVIFVSIGYWGGRGIEHYMGEWAEEAEIVFLGLFLVTVGTVWVISRLRTRRTRRATRAVQASEQLTRPALERPSQRTGTDG